MFREWGFLITEMIGLLAVAALLGLFIGWLIWGRRSTVNVDTSAADRLREDLDKCRALHRDKDARITELEEDVKEKRRALVAANTARSGTAAAAGTTTSSDATSANVGTKPATLTGPRAGLADDLKQIKGVGDTMEALCNALGFYHFDQIANWTPSEVAWVDANLEGFKGRVSRDDWVSQAKLLAAGGATDFSDRVKKGDVY